ncbi:MAG: DNA helicase RecQ [Bauldia sp.]|nr:DNA helicase RecQ [Bauldia sp.]
MPALIDTALAQLRTVFGFEGFRPGQREILEAVLNGENVLAVMPTGSGKSLCYQLPALVRPGLTIVVSPLIALMRDQVAALRANGIEAGSLNSGNDPVEQARVRTALREGRLKLLYLAPEGLARPDLAEMLREQKIALLAIDEAHCVSQWGHDFRPDYLAVGALARGIGATQSIALTATADGPTQADIRAKLFDAPPRTFVRSFDRPNLYLAMQPKVNASRQLTDFLGLHGGESGIVYCLSRKRTETVAASLAASGYRALPYHAGMDSADRARNQDIFLREDGVVMVATVAFGLGIDKPDVRFVCHANLPASVEAYYQEIGRAGRDGLPADTLTLYGIEDMRLRRMQIEESDAPDERKRIERQRFNALLALCESPRCRRQTLLSYFGEESGLCGNCDLCRGAVQLRDGTVDAQKAMSAMVRTGERFGTEHIVQILVGNKTEAVERHGHDLLPTFGVGKDQDANAWRTTLRQIYAAGLIALDIERYGRWYLTDAGRLVLRGKERISLRVPEERRARREKRGQAALPAGSPADEALLADLKVLRRTLATEQKLPAYAIFPDRTLSEIAVRRPGSIGALGEIHGIGSVKLERYGPLFLEVVRRHGSRAVPDIRVAAG